MGYCPTGVYPGGTNPAFIHLTGTIVSWWARIEGMMVSDIMCLRTLPCSKAIAEKERFPGGGKAIVKQWRKLLVNAYEEGSPERAKVDAAVNAALELVHHRNHLVHSFWPYGQNDPEKLELQWVRSDAAARNGARIGSYCMTVEDLDEVNRRLSNLYTRVIAISFNSHRLYPRADLGKPGRAVPVESGTKAS
jgi:hypothetical protein